MDNWKENELLKAKIPCEKTGITVKPEICGFCGGSCLVNAYMTYHPSQTTRL